MKLLLFLTASLAFVAAGRVFIQRRMSGQEMIEKPEKIDTPIRQNGAPQKLVKEAEIDPAMV